MIRKWRDNRFVMYISNEYKNDIIETQNKMSCEIDTKFFHLITAVLGEHNIKFISVDHFFSFQNVL